MGKSRNLIILYAGPALKCGMHRVYITVPAIHVDEVEVEATRKPVQQSRCTLAPTPLNTGRHWDASENSYLLSVDELDHHACTFQSGLFDGRVKMVHQVLAHE